MGAEEEFRKVGEDVRQLARALRHELKGAQWEAKQAARRTREDIRHEYRAYRRGGGRPPWQPPNRPPGWGEGWDARTPGPPRSTVATDAPVWAPRPPRPPRPPKVKRQLPPIRHRRDGSTLLSLLLVLVGLAWLASQTKAFNISLEAALAVSLAVLGAGMVVTARTDWSLSRRSWPVWAGATLLVMLVVSANSGEISRGFSSMSFGAVDLQPSVWSAAQGTVSNLAGPIEVNLTSLPGLPPSDQTLTVRDTFGPVTVNLPSNPALRVHVAVRTIFGDTRLPVNGVYSSAGRDRRIGDLGPASGPVLTLDLSTVFGPITVTAPGPASPERSS